MIAVGGTFANGAISAAFVHAFNCEMHECRASGELRNTDDELEMLANGDVTGYYESRLARGDGYAATALKVIRHESGIGEAANAQLLLEVTVNVMDGNIPLPEGGPDAFMKRVNLDLANAHADLVDKDGFGIKGLLSPKQIQDYHEAYFQSIGLSKHTFGGAIFGHSNNWLFNWCAGCDVEPR